MHTTLLKYLFIQKRLNYVSVNLHFPNVHQFVFSYQ